MPDDSPPLTPEALATWTDQELLTEWMQLTWEPSDPETETLAAEIQRRELEI